MTSTQKTTVDDYKVLHPDFDHIPALVTEDGDVSAVGTAHGRTIPVIGSTRPPVFDVSLHPLDGGKTRIYADDPNEILAAICGDDYRTQLNRCQSIIDNYAKYDDDNDPDGHARRELEHDFAIETTYLGYIRGAFAHKARQVAQGKINDQAKQDGSWDTLSPQEQDVLTRAADTTSQSAPVGVLEDHEFTDGDGNTFTGKRGTWRSNAVPLVLNEVDYEPWSVVPRPYSSVVIDYTTPEGEEQQFEDDISDLNLRIIRVEDAEELLHDLDELNAIKLTVRPAFPVDAMYRDYHANSVEERLERNRAELNTDNQDK